MNIYRRLRWGGNVAKMEEYSVFRILTSKPTGNQSLGMSKHRWEDNIRMELKEISVKTRNWV